MALDPSQSRIDVDLVLSGVPQGTVMGLLLFLIYINDLASVLSLSTACGLFADDCLLYRPIHCMEDKVILQKALGSFFEWDRVWGLKFNVSKCNILHLARPVTKPVRFYTLGGEVISSISEAKYLGVTLSNNYGTRSSQWKPHILNTVSRANQRLGFLHRNLRGSPYKLRETAYLALVRSYLRVLLGYLAPIRQGRDWVLRGYSEESSPLGPMSPWDYIGYRPFERPRLA